MPRPFSRQAEFTLISTDFLAQLLGTAVAPSTTPPLPLLRNRYFGLRHGQSEANVMGVISSNPAVGTVTHGLTPLGRLQATSYICAGQGIPSR